MNETEHIGELYKAAPPVAVTSITILGYGLSDWVFVLTVIYTVLQIGLLVRRLLGKAGSKDPLCAAECQAVKRAREGKAQ